MTGPVPAHLQEYVSDRGFADLSAIPSEYGGHVTVSESSAASGPHLWLRAVAPVDLNDPDGPTHEAPIHLTAANAWRLAEQIRHLVEHHYQGDARPKSDPVPEPEWLIWSHEHGLWWAPDGRGYRADVTEAGRYTRADAEHNCSLRSWAAANRPPEVMVLAPTPELWASPAVREVMRQRVKVATTEAIVLRAARSEGLR